MAWLFLFAMAHGAVAQFEVGISSPPENYEALILAGHSSVDVNFIGSITGSAIEPTITWNVEPPGPVIQSPASENTSIAFSDAGEYKITLSAFDGVETKNAVVKITVSQGVLPSVSVSSSANPPVVATGSSVTLTRTVTDGYPAGTSTSWYKNGTLIVGQTGGTLVLDPISLSSAGAYTAKATNAAGTSVPSNEIELTVYQPPAFTTSPANQAVFAGQNATFQSLATGSPSPTYKWTRGNSNASLATTPNYTLLDAQNNDDGAVFTVTATVSVSGQNFAAQRQATLTVYPKPSAVSVSITPNPVVSGALVDFAASATGQQIAYAWYEVAPGTDVEISTSAAFSLNSSTLASGTQFYCIATNPAGSTRSDTATLTINPATSAPVISVHPASQTKSVGQPVTFSVTASGNPSPTYQWRRGGVDIENATSSSYTVTSTAIGDNGVNFRVLVSNGVAPNALSNIATLTVLYPPVLVNVPVSGSANVGTAVNFTLTATGNPSPTFSATGLPSGLTLNSTTGALTGTLSPVGTYNVKFKATNSQGADSSSITYTVNALPAAPTITTEPTPKTVVEGATATFSVAATGNPSTFSYQWRENGVNIAGATAASYTTPPTSVDDNGDVFSVIVSNGVNPAATSGNATLTVQQPPTFTNTFWPTSGTVGTPVASFSLTASGNPTPTFSATGLPPGVTVASNGLYSGTPTTAGTYSVIFTASNGVSPAATKSQTLTIAPAPVGPTITTHPASLTVTAPDNAAFSVAATGTAPLSYAWFRNNAVIAGATSSSYSFATASGNNLDSFYVVVTNSVSSQTSNKARLTVQYKPQITAHPQPQNVTAPATATFSVSAVGNPANLTYQWRRTVGTTTTNISGATGATYAFSTVNGDNGAQFSAAVTNAAGTTVSNAAALSVNAALTKPNITADPASLTVTAPNKADFSVAFTGNPTPSIKWQRNGTDITGATTSSFSLNPTAAEANGALFRAIATNSQGADTSAYASLTVLYAPTITAQPKPDTVSDGQAATFSVAGNGNPAVTYRWWTKGAGISSATGSTYTTGALTMADSGRYYHVRLSNSVAEVLSDSVRVVVLRVAPSITAQPVAVTVNEGQAATFTVVAAGSATLTYQWRKSNANLTGNGATTASYSITSAAYADSGAEFDCVVRNSAGSATTAKVKLNVRKVIVAPVISNTNLTLNATIGSPVTFQINATGTAPLAYSAAPLPAGLALDGNTGLISGTPTAAGTTAITLGVSNAAATVNKTLTLIVGTAPVAPIINSVLSATGNVGIAFSYTITASGTGPFTFSTSTLPPGLALDAATGLISGIPTTVGKAQQITMTATNSVGSNSKTLVLTLDPKPVAPQFTLNLPDTVIRKEKDSLALRVIATGEPAPTYTWEYISPGGQVSVLSTTSPTYRIDTLSEVASGGYRVRATNASGSVTSKTCTLTVVALPVKPVFLQQPASQTVTLGQSVSFSVNTTGKPPFSYQWRKGGKEAANNIPGANSATYAIPAAALADAGLYYCRVAGSDEIPGDTNTFSISNPATLTVNAPKVDIPKTNISDTLFTSEISVSLRTDTLGTVIRYTLNGDAPTDASPALDTNQRLRISATTVLRARATKPGLMASDVLTRNYTFVQDGKVALTPFQPADSVFTGGTLKVTLGAYPPSSAIWYTTDGSSPAANGPTSLRYDTAAGILVTASVTLKAQAFLSPLIPSEIATKRYVLDKPKSKVAAPAATPPGKRFVGSQLVSLATTTDSSRIWFTVDGSSPFTSPTRSRYLGILTLNATTTLKAMAERDGWIDSDTLVALYLLVPGPITSSPPGDIDFDTSLTVSLQVEPAGTPLYCTLDGSEPLDEKLTPGLSAFIYGSPLEFRQSTVLRCLALGADRVPSDPLFRFYNLSSSTSLLPPAAEPSSRSFRDSLKVTLRSSRSSQSIYYTLNGEDPDPATSMLYRDTLVIDTTTTLRAIAAQAGFTHSPLVVQNYTLQPDTPQARPRGGIYAGSQTVVLTNRSRKVAMYYTLSGETPNPATATRFLAGDAIPITASSTLKAIAVAGNLASPVLEANYNIIDSTTNYLLANTSFVIPGTAFSLYHSGEPATTLEVSILPSGTIRAGGFNDISFGLRIRPMPGSNSDAAKFPKVVFNKPVSEIRSLYRTGVKKPYFISKSDSVSLLEAGTYFLGRDTMPPLVEFVGDIVVNGDSTQIEFAVNDNVSNLLYDFIRSDAPDAGQVQAPVMAGDYLTFRLKSPEGNLLPLTASLSVTDGAHTVRFPEKANESIILAQSLADAQSGNSVRLGIKEARSWDLVSLPVQPSRLFTAKEFWAANPEVKTKSIYGYQPVNGGTGSLYRLADKDTLRPWQGYWMAADPAPAGISLPEIVTKPIAQDEIKIKLKQGWNLVGLPLAKKMYWPIPRILGEGYDSSFIKAPIGFATDSNKYVKSDSLEPWRGYWVYCTLYGNQADTTLTLSQTRVTTRPAMGKQGPKASIFLVLASSEGQTVELGAKFGANDAAGIEDEPAFPILGQSQGRLIAKRSGRSLMVDWVNYKPGDLMSWTLLQTLPSEKTEKPPQTDPYLTLSQAHLPPGYGIALVSKRRRIHYALNLAMPVPPSEGPQDSLSVWAAPQALLKQALQGYTAGPPPFSSALLHQGGRRSLRLDLPTPVVVEWLLCDARGRILENRRSRHAEGRQWLPIESSQAPMGILFLRVEIRGHQFRRSLSYRFSSLP